MKYKNLKPDTEFLIDDPVSKRSYTVAEWVQIRLRAEIESIEKAKRDAGGIHRTKA